MESTPEPSADRATWDRGMEPSDAEKLELVARVLDLVPDFFYVHDEEMRFMYANAAAARYFGFSSGEELVGRRLIDVDPDKEQARFFIEVCRGVMREGTPRLTDALPYRRRDGSAGVLRQHDIPFVNPKTGGRMLLGLSRDVTAERELAEQRERAARMEHELRLAREIQESLRPRSAEVPEGLEVAGSSEPALYAGGDFYDWGVAPDGGFLAALGDVTGHGIGPALVAATCRAYARVLAGELPPAEAVSRLNEWMCEESKAGRFVTFALVRVDPGTFEYAMVSAGQGPVMLVEPGSRPRDLEVVMPPLGVDPAARAERGAAGRLGRGQSLVLVSDGVYEAMDGAGRKMGLERMREVVARAADGPAEGIHSAVVSAVREHGGGGALADDVSVVVVRRA